MLYRCRVLPLSQGRGFDYGTPVNRYYSGSFIRSHAHEVRGRILEFGWPDYKAYFDPARVERYDIMSLTSGEHVTIVADVQKMPQVTDASFDCIVCTQVLLLVPDPFAAAAEIYRVLTPGGLLLMTVPRVSLTAPRNGFPGDYWRFTEDSLRLLLAPFSEVSISIHGNPIAAFCAANRIAIEDASRADLDWADPRFPLHVNVYARK
jgi:SAM-dependent methyltransferase